MKRLKQLIKNYKVKKENKYLDKLTERVACRVAEYGDNLKVFGDVTLFSPTELRIGKNCKINDNTYINALSGITIGDNVTISQGAKLISTGYDIDKWMETGEKVHVTDTPITIGNHCWIGAGAIILPGVNITGEYVVIGAGAVVTKDITESRVLVAGNPAQIVKRYN